MALTDNLLAYWKLDDTSWSDSSGNGHTLTDNNGVTTITGKISGAADLTGGGKYLSYSNFPNTDDISVSFWMKWDGTFPNYELAIPINRWSGNTAPAGREWLFIITQNNNHINFGINDASTTNVSYPIVADVWYFICGTYDSATGTKTLTVNNGIATVTDTPAPIFSASSPDLIIGRYTDLSPSYDFSGVIDEVGIWSRVLTQNEITSIYNGGIGNTYLFSLYADSLAYWKLDDTSWSDSSGNGHTLTNNNGVTVGTGILSGCAVFDGNNRLGSTTFGVNIDNDFTVSFWINPSVLLNGFQHIFGAPFQNGLYIGGGTTVGTLQIGLYNGTVYVLQSEQIPNGSWTYCVLKRSGDILEAYINSVSIGTIDITGQIFNNTSVISIGGGEFNEYYFTGKIDEVGIWNRVLNETEINLIYISGLSGLKTKKYNFQKVLGIPTYNFEKVTPQSILDLPFYVKR
jgi:hypothetical protein